MNNPQDWLKHYRDKHYQGMKMTREEAERKLYPHQWGTEKRKEFLDGLEALGLIKFDEPPVVDVVAQAKDYLKSGEGFRLNNTGKYRDIIKGLVKELEKRPNPVGNFKVGDFVSVSLSDLPSGELALFSQGYLMSIGKV